MSCFTLIYFKGDLIHSLFGLDGISIRNPWKSLCEWSCLKLKLKSELIALSSLLKADSWIVRIFQCSMCTASCWMHLSVFFLGDLLNPRVVNRMRKFGFAVWSTLLKSAVDMFTSLVSSPIIVTCRICWNTSKTHQPQFCINMLIFRMTNLTSLY